MSPGKEEITTVVQNKTRRKQKAMGHRNILWGLGFPRRFEPISERGKSCSVLLQVCFRCLASGSSAKSRRQALSWSAYVHENNIQSIEIEYVFTVFGCEWIENDPEVAFRDFPLTLVPQAVVVRELSEWCFESKLYCR